MKTCQSTIDQYQCTHARCSLQIALQIEDARSFLSTLCSNQLPFIPGLVPPLPLAEQRCGQRARNRLWGLPDAGGVPQGTGPHPGRWGALLPHLPGANPGPLWGVPPSHHGGSGHPMGATPSGPKPPGGLVPACHGTKRWGGVAGAYWIAGFGGCVSVETPSVRGIGFIV